MPFNPNSKADLFVRIEGPAPSETKTETPRASEEERLASARQRAMMRAKQFNLLSHPTSYWTDFAGAESSQWDATRLLWICHTLRIQGYQLQTEDRRNGLLEHYDARAGAWRLNDQRISIQQVRELIDKRIQALRLSKVKIVEYLADSTFEESQAFISEPFDGQMNRFREGKAL